MDENVKDSDLAGHTNNLDTREMRILYRLWNEVFKIPVSSLLGGRKIMENSVREFVIEELVLKGSHGAAEISKSQTYTIDFSVEKENISSQNNRINGHLSGLRSLPIWHGFLASFDDPDVNMLRFLRARDWNLEDAYTMVYNTIKWRLSEDVYDIMLCGERGIKGSLLESDKVFFNGPDKCGRPVLYLCARKHFKNEQSLMEVKRHVIFYLELTRYFLLQGYETALILIDVGDVTYSNFDLVAIKFIIDVFQDNCPEGLYKCFIINAHWFFKKFWKVLRVFIDPRVSSKIFFINDMKVLLEYIDKDVLLSQFGGNNAYEYKYDGIQNEDNPVDDDIKRRIESEYFSLIDEFVSKTREIFYYLETNPDMKEPTNELLEQVERRNNLKHGLRTISRHYSNIVYAKSYYHRIGVIDDKNEAVDWSKFIVHSVD